MPYIGKAPSSGIRSRFIYTATAGQTTFTGADDNNKTLGYTDSEYVDVYLNGVLLEPADYTATSKTSVVLDSGATVGDTMEIVVYDTFSVFNGTFSGDLTVDGTTLHVDSTNNRIGVGTLTPENPIEIETANTLGSTFTGTTHGEGLRVTQSSYSSGNFVSLVEAPYKPNRVPNVRIAAMFDGGGSNLAFGTSNSFGSGITNTAMFIDSSGVVGILTATPSNAQLDVEGRGRFLQNASATTGAVIIRESSSGVGGHIQFVSNANDAQRGYIGSNSDGDLLLGAVGTERLKIAGSNGLLTALSVYNLTTSGAANVNVQSSGAILRSTSSEKYKKNIEDMELSYAQAILNLRPVYYKSKCDFDNDDHSHWGFIAEEVEKVDPRLVHYKTTDVTFNEVTDDDGVVLTQEKVETILETPEPEGVQYDRLTPAIVKLLQEQQKTIEALETRLTALEAE